jgi:hypothetical protein
MIVACAGYDIFATMTVFGPITTRPENRFDPAKHGISPGGGIGRHRGLKIESKPFSSDHAPTGINNESTGIDPEKHGSKRKITY